MLWCLTPLSKVFRLYRGGKTTDLSQVTHKLYPIMLFQEHIKRTKLVVIGTVAHVVVNPVTTRA